MPSVEVECAFGHVGLDWEEHVEIDPKYFRPSEVDVLLGDPSKVERELGWKPRVTFAELVQIMVDADVRMLANEGRPWIDAPGGSAGNRADGDPSGAGDV